MVSMFDSVSRGPGLSPGRGHCVVFLGNTLDSHSASLHPIGYRLTVGALPNKMLEGNLVLDLVGFMLWKPD